jgi:hypothetical protein
VERARSGFRQTEVRLGEKRQRSERRATSHPTRTDCF